MKYDFEDIVNRKGNGSKKWNSEYIEKRFPNHNRDIYPLFIADMDYKLPKEILERLNEFISNADFGYFDLDEDFYEAIINWQKKINKIDIKKEDILGGAGTVTTLGIILKGTLQKGDEIVLFTPVYGPFKEIIENNDFKIIKEKLIEKNDEYKIDFKSLEESFKKGAKGIIICNPQNPSGRVWKEEEIQKIIDLAKKYKVMIYSDEIHSDLMLYKNKFTSLANYFEDYENIVICTSPNKTFNLAGIGSSYVLIRNEKIREKAEETLKKERIEISRIGAETIKIVYEEGEEWLKALIQNLQENIQIVNEELKELDIEIMETASSYLMWIKLNKIKDTLKFSQELAKETGVLVETGTRFIDNNQSYIRINVATSKKVLKEALEKIKEYYKKL